MVKSLGSELQMTVSTSQLVARHGTSEFHFPYPKMSCLKIKIKGKTKQNCLRMAAISEKYLFRATVLSAITKLIFGKSFCSYFW